MNYHADNVMINHLRIRSHVQLAQTHARLLSDQLLADGLALSELPASAILLVKKLQMFYDEQDFVSPQLSQRQEWQRKIQQNLQASYALATHPDKGFIATESTVIVFCNSAEMIACLALDVVHGEHRRRWWWKSVTSGLPAAVVDDVSSLLAWYVRELPTVFAFLHAWGKGAELVAGLDDEQTRHIVNVIVAEFHLDSALKALTLAPVDAEETDIFTETGAQQNAPPWSEWYSVGESEESAIKQVLAGITLGLYVAPSKIRTATFSEAVQRWWASMQAKTRLAANQTHSRKDVSAWQNQSDLGHIDDEASSAYDVKQSATNQKDDTCAELESEHELSDVVTTDSEDAVQRSASDEKSSAINITSDKVGERFTNTEAKLRSWQSRYENAGETDGIADSQHRFENDAIQQSQQNAILHQESKAQTVTEQAVSNTGQNLEKVEYPLSMLQNASGVKTRLGGVFYLLNLMRYLELPGCFSQQCQLNQELGYWGLLELLAKVLLAERFEEYADDPVWRLLCHLDGREPRQALGADFQFSGEYHIPRVWLDILCSTSDIHYFAEDQTYLWIWSDLGFVLHCIKLPDTTLKSHAELCQELLQQDLVGDDSPCVLQGNIDDLPIGRFSIHLQKWVGADLLAWLSLMFPALECRLHQSMFDDPLTRGRHQDYLHILLQCPATFHDTGVHIDLVTELEHISLPVRLAGLDRDPGWLPDIGRVVSFHYR